MSKSENAFRTISEVAGELDVPQHVLRFWESKFSQVKPMKRAGGRRYYRPADVDLLCGIRVLLYVDGYTIKGVQKVLKEKGARYVADAGQRNRNGGDPAGSGAAEATTDLQHEPATAGSESIEGTQSAPADGVTITRKPESDTRKLTDTQHKELSRILGELTEIRQMLSDLGR